VIGQRNRHLDPVSDWLAGNPAPKVQKDLKYIRIDANTVENMFETIKIMMHRFGTVIKIQNNGTK
jgi:hypothetical protein